MWVNSTGPQNMRTLKNYCATLTLDGVANFRSPAAGTHTLRPGDLLLVFPGVPHFYGPAKGCRWTEFFADFDGPAFDLLTGSGMLDPAKPILHVEPVEYWLRRFREIMVDPLRGGPELVAGRVCRLQQFLVDAAAYHKGQAGRIDNLGWLDDAKAILINAGARPPRDLHDIARQFSMSYDTFRKKFVHLTGISPGAYRIHHAIDRGAHLIIDRSDMPLKQVASMCGFCNEFYFSKQFKKIMQVSPREFRRRFFSNRSRRGP
jgi:AraC-like DNA-binding protein